MIVRTDWSRCCLSEPARAVVAGKERLELHRLARIGWNIYDAYSRNLGGEWHVLSVFMTYCFNVVSAT